MIMVILLMIMIIMMMFMVILLIIMVILLMIMLIMMMSQEVFIEEPEHHHEEGEAMNNTKTELVYASQGGQYVNENGEYIDDPQQPTQLITSDGSFIDASSNHLVMSDGALVSLVPEEPPAAQENVVNIVTSTATNEQGQQIIIIDNLDQHSPELQREIMKALMADHTIVPISQ